MLIRLYFSHTDANGSCGKGRVGLNFLTSFEEKEYSTLQCLIMPLLWHKKVCSVRVLIFLVTGVHSEALSEKGFFWQPAK